MLVRTILFWTNWGRVARFTSIMYHDMVKKPVEYKWPRPCSSRSFDTFTDKHIPYLMLVHAMDSCYVLWDNLGINRACVVKITPNMYYDMLKIPIGYEWPRLWTSRLSDTFRDKWLFTPYILSKLIQWFRILLIYVSWRAEIPTEYEWLLPWSSRSFDTLSAMCTLLCDACQYNNLERTDKYCFDMFGMQVFNECLSSADLL